MSTTTRTTTTCVARVPQWRRSPSMSTAVVVSFVGWTMMMTIPRLGLGTPPPPPPNHLYHGSGVVSAFPITPTPLLQLQLLPTTTSSSTTTTILRGVRNSKTAEGSDGPFIRSATETIIDVTSSSSTVVVMPPPTPQDGDDKNQQPRIPVVLLSGFLGSGKTSALQHLLLQEEGPTDNNYQQLGVLVNDVAAINIDAKYIAARQQQQQQNNNSTTTEQDRLTASAKYEVMELQNGCACCSLQDDFLTSLEGLIQNRVATQNDERRNMFDAIIVELSGVADPAAIQNNWRSIMTTTSTTTESSSLPFPHLTRYCDTEVRIVTLVDACTFGTDYMTWDVIGERPVWVTTDNVDDCNERRKVSELLVEQVEAAHVVLINKVDLATPEQQTVCQRVIQALNGAAEIIPVQYGKVSPQQLFGNSAFVSMEPQQVNDEAHVVDATETPCHDTKCTDPTHTHSHRDHDHTKDATATNDHSHNTDTVTCQDPTCTDTSHSHSHDDHHHHHNHPSDDETNTPPRTSTEALGFVNFVYKANRPFHTQRIMSTLSQWPIPIKETLDLGTLYLNDNAPYEIDGTMVVPSMYENKISDISPFIGVLRSKGFCWFAPQKWTGATNDAWRHDTAMYWSHAGRQFGISTAGKWWATMTATQMAKYFDGNVVEYERILRDDFVSDEFGDRRQEIVFIGIQLNPEDITAALNACLLTDNEMDYYRQKLRNLMDEKTFASKTTANTSNGLFNVDTINHMDI